MSNAIAHEVFYKDYNDKLSWGVLFVIFFPHPVFVESILIFLSVQENWQSLSFNISNKSK